MDPTKTFELFLKALLDGHWQDAEEHYANLKEWLDKGGFEPNWNEPQKKVFDNYNPETGLVNIWCR